MSALLAWYQPLMVGGSKFAQDVVQLTAPRHDLALQEIEFLLAGRVLHGIGKRVHHGEELIQALAQVGNHSGAVRRARQIFQRLLVFLLQSFHLAAKNLGSVGTDVDEEIPNIITGKPEVAAQCAQNLLLVNVMAVDSQMLLGDTHLNAVSFHRGKNQYAYDNTVAGPQHGPLAPDPSHSSSILSLNGTQTKHALQLPSTPRFLSSSPIAVWCMVFE